MSGPHEHQATRVAPRELGDEMMLPMSDSGVYTLFAQAMTMQFKSAAIQDAENMMTLMAQWDALTYAEKLREVHT